MKRLAVRHFPTSETHSKGSEEAIFYDTEILPNMSKLHVIGQFRNKFVMDNQQIILDKKLTPFEKSRLILKDDIPMRINVVLSTASNERVTIFDLLLAHNGKLIALKIEKSLNMAPPTARRTMLELWVLRLVDKDNPRRYCLYTSYIAKTRI